MLIISLANFFFIFFFILRKGFFFLFFSSDSLLTERQLSYSRKYRFEENGKNIEKYIQ
jgi:hypothetical protein